MNSYFQRHPSWKRVGLLVMLASVGAASLWLAPPQTASARQAAQRPSVIKHRMTKITETIYRADNPGTPGINATSWVFVNDKDVLVTDSEGSPASARSLIEGVRSITDKPIRYLVDTHFHIDHAYGNAGLPSSIQIIGHEYTRKALLGREAREGVTFRTFVDPMPAHVEDLRKQAAAETNPQKKAMLNGQLASAEATLKVYQGAFPLEPPNLTLKSSMSVWSGAKEFRIMWLGRGHTAGDLVIYVPSERAAASGDLVFKGRVGWQGDAFMNEQPATLEKLKQLDIDFLFPAHGNSSQGNDHIQGKANIDATIATMQAFLREEWRQAAEAKQQGASPENALKKIDLSRFKDAYGAGTTPSIQAVQRIYDLIDGKGAAN